MPIASKAPTIPAPTGSATTGANTAKLRTHVLEVPYAHRPLVAEAGGRWDATVRAHVWKGVTLPAALRAYAAAPYSWEAYQEDLANGTVRAPSKPTKAIVPHQHQIECVRVMTEAIRRGRDNVLIADDVGLGKTISAWLTILALPDKESVLIVCPLAAVAHWRRTIEWLGDGGKTVVVINYDRMKTLFDVPDTIRAASRRKGKARKAAKVRSLKGVAKHGDAIEFDVAVFDESHRLRNIASARTKLAFALYEATEVIVWLSATAGQTPLELGYLYPLLMQATGGRKSQVLEWERWCHDQGIGVSKGAFGKWEWDPVDRDADLAKVNRYLFGGPVVAGIRRSPVDIAGWPEKTRILLPVALDPEDRRHYELAWAEFRDALALTAGKGRDGGSGLVGALRFRQKASLLRTAATVDLATELLSQGYQVAISVAFLETLGILRDALEPHGVAVIKGGVPPSEKEAERLRFQRGERRVCLYTVTEAISLHEGEQPGGERRRANLIHDLRWSGIDMHQLEGRCHRDGKHGVAYWMVGEDTIEERVAGVMAGRMASMADLQGDEATSAAIADVLMRLPRPAAAA